MTAFRPEHAKLPDDEVEEVRNEALAGALYFHTLLKEGVPPLAAVQMSQSYVSGRMMAHAEMTIVDGDDPPEPWQGG